MLTRRRLGIGGREADGRHDGAGGGIGRLAAVDGQRFETKMIMGHRRETRTGQPRGSPAGQSRCQPGNTARAYGRAGPDGSRRPPSPVWLRSPTFPGGRGDGPRLLSLGRERGSVRASSPLSCCAINPVGEVAQPRALQRVPPLARTRASACPALETPKRPPTPERVSARRAVRSAQAKAPVSRTGSNPARLLVHQSECRPGGPYGALKRNRRLAPPDRIRADS